MKQNTIRYFKPVYITTLQKEEIGDAIVPDSSPDIAQVISTSGLACIKDKYIRDGMVEVSGVIKATILYTPEGMSGLRRITINLPFSHGVDHADIAGEVIANVMPSVIAAETRLLNSRKVQVTVTLSLGIEVLTLTDCHITHGVEDESLHILTQTQSACVPVAAREKDFVVQEEVELPSSKPPIEELLHVSVTPTARDINVIGNKLVFKGIAALSMLYTAPDSTAVHTFAQDVAFSQIVEMDGMEEACHSSVDLQLTGLELDVRTGMSLDTRILGITLPMVAFAKAHSELHIETLTDAYSITQDCALTHAAYTFSQVDERQGQHVAVREQIETGVGVAAVYDTSVVLGAPEYQHVDGKMVAYCEAHVRVLYAHDDGGYATATRRVAVTCPLDDDNWELAVSAASDVSAAATQEGLELRFGVDFNLTKSREVTISTVSNIELTDFAEDAAPRPSVVLRRAVAGEQLWDIAKTYKTTITDIQAANALENDVMTADAMLLIPKRR